MTKQHVIIIFIVTFLAAAAVVTDDCPCPPEWADMEIGCVYDKATTRPAELASAGEPQNQAIHPWSPEVETVIARLEHRLRSNRTDGPAICLSELRREILEFVETEMPAAGATATKLPKTAEVDAFLARRWMANLRAFVLGPVWPNSSEISATWERFVTYDPDSAVSVAEQEEVELVEAMVCTRCEQLAAKSPTGTWEAGSVCADICGEADRRHAAVDVPPSAGQIAGEVAETLLVLWEITLIITWLAVAGICVKL